MIKILIQEYKLFIYFCKSLSEIGCLVYCQEVFDDIFDGVIKFVHIIGDMDHYFVETIHGHGFCLV